MSVEPSDLWSAVRGWVWSGNRTDARGNRKWEGNLICHLNIYITNTVL
ncbi:MAG: hypothetical protein LBC76_12145 [Treponema sp.]|nr:hypothetical protein [Treponema sp.]